MCLSKGAKLFLFSRRCLPSVNVGSEEGFTTLDGKRLGMNRDGGDGMSVRQTVQKPQQRDLYEVLGLPQRSASTAEEIKTAYKKAALKFHPDKQDRNNKAAAEQAARQFQEVSAAYAVLSDPTRRQKYDTRGFAALEPNELENTEVDVSSLGLFSTFAAAMFSKLGIPIKTTIATNVVDAAYEGKFKATRLAFAQSIADKVDKGQAAFYDIMITKADVDAGFVIGAHSSVGSKFKLLLFEETETGRWEVHHQEDSAVVKQGMSLASVFCMSDRMYQVGQKPLLEVASNPEAQLFLRLESLVPREQLHVKPGRLVIAVYGDNWFKRAQYTITAVLPSKHNQSSAALADIKQLESKLLLKQSAIRAFEREYRQAQEHWKQACDQYTTLGADVEGVLAQRDSALLKLLGV